MRISIRFAVSGVLLGLLMAVPARAISNRIFMSTNGNNAGDCANPLTPCLTFVGALAQVNPGGEVIAEATGGYGALNVTQAVTISGPPGVVIYSGLPVSVNAPGATVVLRGLTIDGTGQTGTGISVTSVGTLFIESCVIANFAGTGSDGNGIFFASPGNLFVKDTVVRNNAQAGIDVKPASGSAKASVVHSRFEGNGFGVISDGGSVTTVGGSVASGNSQVGFFANLGGELNLEKCVAANNFFGIESAGTGSIARLSNSTVTDNNTGLLVSLGSLLSRGNNTVEGNTNTDGTFTGTYTAK